MATITLIVVLIVLVGYLAILYLPFDNKKKAMLSAMVFGALLMCVLAVNAWNNEVPAHIGEVASHNPEAKKAMMTTFNLSEEKLNSPTENPTPIELGVTVALVLALVLTPLLVVVVRNDNETTAKGAYNIAFSLSAAALAFMLSLYYGLELAILPYRKTSEEGKTSPALA